MTGFVPPKPPTRSRKATVLERLRSTSSSSLSLFRPGSYASLGVSRYWIPELPFLRKRWIYVAREPALVREMLVARQPDFPKGATMHAMMRSLTGESIFTTNGEVWRRQRRIIDPSLEQTRVRESFARMREAAEVALADLERRGRDGRAVRIDHAMTQFAADVIFRTIFSEPLEPRSARAVFRAFETFQRIAFAHGMIGLSRLPTAMFPGALSGVLAAHRIRRHIARPLARRLAEARAGTPPRTDILGAMLASRDPQTGLAFTPRELLDQICALFLAGHETSASGIAWALYLIAADPEVQTRLRAEVASVAGDRALEFSDIARLRFTRDVVRETLRLYPPVAFVGRDATRPECAAGRKIDPGSVIFISQWLMHRHEVLWRDPDVFDPGRFSTEEGHQSQKCAYLPFSMGPRSCPGASFAMQESVMAIAMIVRRFDLALTDGPPPIPQAKLTLRSANGISLVVTPRQAGSTTAAEP